MSGYDHSRAGAPSSGPLITSIVTIIIVMTVVTTTLTYSAPMALESSTSTTSSPGIVLVWSNTTSYPVSLWTSSCVTSSGYIYCVGGESGATGTTPIDDVYYAQLSPSGVGPWLNTTSYPTQVSGESCVTSSAAIYCIGGANDSAILNNVYYASLSSGGVGSWASTAPYPVGIWLNSCAASATGVYCIGGGSDLSNVVASSTVYYAPFSGSGLGNWTSAPAYPIPVRQESCLTTSSDLYCFGGRDVTAVYYAPVTSSGLGPWASTTGYPFTVGANLMSCVSITSTVYCVAGHTGANVSDDVYEAPLSTSGVGRWSPNTRYTVSVWGLSCVSTDEAIYCAGGEGATSVPTDTVSYSPV